MNTPARTEARHRVVIIGSGFGGLFAAKALRRADVDVLVVDRTSHHLFQPLLYQVATGILSEGEIAPSTRMVLKKQSNASVMLGGRHRHRPGRAHDQLDPPGQNDHHRVRQSDRLGRSPAVVFR